MILLQECEKRGVSVHGVVNAAALKAIAAYKQVGAKGEHYGSVVLLQCRSRLQPPLPDFAIGKFSYSIATDSHENCFTHEMLFALSEFIPV